MVGRTRWIINWEELKSLYQWPKCILQGAQRYVKSNVNSCSSDRDAIEPVELIINVGIVMKILKLFQTSGTPKYLGSKLSKNFQGYFFQNPQRIDNENQNKYIFWSLSLYSNRVLRFFNFMRNRFRNFHKSWYVFGLDIFQFKFF